MLIGKIKWFDPQRGYGFIALNSYEDVFVHYSAINMRGWRSLSEGDVVQYELARSHSGYLALNVTRIG